MAYQEFKVYDGSRHPPEWTALLGPSQCAAFFNHAQTGAPLLPDGTPVDRLRDCLFVRFDSIQEARIFCEENVRRFPYMRCEIFDFQGKANPPMLAITDPRVSAEKEPSTTSIRKTKVLAFVLIIGALPLFWWDWRHGLSLVLPTVIGINMIVAALRFLYWHSGRADEIRDRERRLHEHLRREEQAVRDQSPDA